MIDMGNILGDNKGQSLRDQREGYHSIPPLTTGDYVPRPSGDA